jgi:hypothetical protein
MQTFQLLEEVLQNPSPVALGKTVSRIKARPFSRNNRGGAHAFRARSTNDARPNGVLGNQIHSGETPYRDHFSRAMLSYAPASEASAGPGPIQRYRPAERHPCRSLTRVVLAIHLATAFAVRSGIKFCETDQASRHFGVRHLFEAHRKK